MNTIQTNLEALNLPPLPKEVSVKVGIWEDAPVDVGTWDLEALCLDYKVRSAVWEKVRAAGHPDHSFSMQLSGPDGFRATLSSDGDIALWGVDLRTAYLVRAVSEWGKDHILDPAGMITDKAIPWMLEYVRAWYEEHPLHYNKDGSVQEYHYSEGRTADRFLSATQKDGYPIPGEYGVKDFFRYQKETQFGDGYCGAVGDFWKAACWELFGEERDYPYQFCY